LGINRTGYLERYFDLHFYGQLSQVEFDNAFNKPLEDWLQYIESKQSQTEILNEMLDFLDWKNTYSNTDEFNKAVEGMLKIFQHSKQFDQSMIEKKFIPPGMTFSLKEMRQVYPLYELFGSKEQYANYLLTLFEKYSAPGNLLLEYLYILATNPGNLPLTREKVVDVLRTSFDKALQEGNKFNMDIFLLYANLSSFVNTETLKQQFKNFIIEKDMDGFIEAAIQPSPFGKPGKYWIAPFVKEIFGSIDSFMEVPEFKNQDTQSRQAFIELRHNTLSPGNVDAVLEINRYPFLKN